MNKEILNKNQKYIIGVSGGVDSMVLLDQLYQFNYQLIVCHVNYHYRHDSNIDEQLVKKYCQERNIPCHIHNVKNSQNKENFQSHARDIRYQFYQSIGQKYQIEDVILGHHQDDVIETIYMQVERKNLLSYLGIKSISKVYNLNVYRPMLDCTKAMIYEYARKNEIPYHEDYTNFETEFTRDYIRNVTLKAYTQEQKNALLDYAFKHNQKINEIETMMEKYYQEYEYCNKIKYDVLNEIQLKKIIYYILKTVMHPPKITTKLVTDIYQQCLSSKPNIIISLPCNHQFIKEYDTIYVTKNDKEGFAYIYQQIQYLQEAEFELSNTGHLNCGIQLQSDDFPITIRSFQNGDQIKTVGGTKKISRLFIDRKVPLNDRKLWPILINRHGIILLVPMLAKNIDYLYTKPNLYVVK